MEDYERPHFSYSDVSKAARSSLEEWIVSSGFKLGPEDDTATSTHRSLWGGNYSIPDDCYQEFLVQYVSALQKGWHNISIHECAKAVTRFFLDVDFARCVETHNVSEMEAMKTNSLKLIRIILAQLHAIVPPFKAAAVFCTPLREVKGNKGTFKWGYHIYSIDGPDGSPPLWVDSEISSRIVTKLTDSMRQNEVATELMHSLGVDDWANLLDAAVYLQKRLGLRMPGCYKCEMCKNDFHNARCCGDYPPYKVTDKQAVYRPEAFFTVERDVLRFKRPPSSWWTQNKKFPSVEILLATSLRYECPEKVNPFFTSEGAAEQLPARPAPLPRKAIAYGDASSPNTAGSTINRGEWVNLTRQDPRWLAIEKNVDKLLPTQLRRIDRVCYNDATRVYAVWPSDHWCLNRDNANPNSPSHNSAKNYLLISPSFMQLKCSSKKTKNDVKEPCTKFRKALGSTPPHLKGALFPDDNTHGNELQSLQRCIKQLRARTTEAPLPETDATSMEEIARRAVGTKKRGPYTCGKCKQPKQRGHQCPERANLASSPDKQGSAKRQRLMFHEYNSFQ